MTPISFESMTHTEIIAHFESYGFKDVHGHDLTRCLDFLELAEALSRCTPGEVEHV